MSRFLRHLKFWNDTFSKKKNRLVFVRNADINFYGENIIQNDSKVRIPDKISRFAKTVTFLSWSRFWLHFWCSLRPALTSCLFLALTHVVSYGAFAVQWWKQKQENCEPTISINKKHKRQTRSRTNTNHQQQTHMLLIVWWRGTISSSEAPLLIWCALYLHPPKSMFWA